MGRRILIIGGGIAGLSVGSYLVRNGFETVILEQHSLCGGLCTSWRRKGYVMDYCIHWLMGTDAQSESRKMWEELGAFDNADGSKMPIVNPDYFTRIGLSDGETLCLWSDIDRLEGEMIRIGPEDEAPIRRFCRSLRRLAKLDISVTVRRRGRLGRLANFLRHAGPNLTMMHHATTTIGQFAKEFKNPRLREALSGTIPGDWSLIALSLGLALQHTRRAGYPVGGSLRFSQNIERLYTKLGGQIRYQARVTSILVEGSRAVGVRLSSGEELRGDQVISAADGHQTIFEMLPKRELPPVLENAYKQYPLFPSSIFVGLGVGADLSHLPHASMPYLKDPLVLPDGDTHRSFHVGVYHYDPTLAPEGKTFVAVLINSWKGQHWIDFKGSDPEAYGKEKERIGEFVMDTLEQTFGGIREAVEVCDVSTPATVARFTGNWQGSYEGFAPTPKTVVRSLPKILTGLSGFRMIGQWTTPGGGLPTAAKDGRNTAIKMCEEYRQPFKSRA